MAPLPPAPSLLRWLRPMRLLWWAACLMAALLGWAWINYPTLQEYFKAQAFRNSQSEQVRQLRQRRDQLDRDQRALQAGTGFAAEKAIRERLGMIRPGEKVLIVATPEPADAPSSPAAATEAPGPPSPADPRQE
jgi:cell division protein FtsB